MLLAPVVWHPLKSAFPVDINIPNIIFFSWALLKQLWICTSALNQSEPKRWAGKYLSFLQRLLSSVLLQNEKFGHVSLFHAIVPCTTNITVQFANWPSPYNFSWGVTKGRAPTGLQEIRNGQICLLKSGYGAIQSIVTILNLWLPCKSKFYFFFNLVIMPLPLSKYVWTSADD